MRHSIVLITLCAQLCAVAAQSAEGDSPSAGAAALETANAEEASPDGAAAHEAGGEPLEEAQPEPLAPTQDEFLLREAERLNLRIAELASRIEELKRRSEGVVGEDKLVIERELIRTKLETLDVVGEMVENFQRQLRSGIDTVAQRKIIEDLLTDIGPSIGAHVGRSEERLARMRREREAYEGTALLDLEQKIVDEMTWLDTLFRAAKDHVDRMEAMGMPSDAVVAEVEKGLVERADESAGRIRLVLDQIAALESRAGDSPSDPQDQVLMTALSTRRESTIRSLQTIVRIMSQLELETAVYEQLLITSTGAVTADIFKPEVAVGLIEQGVDEVGAWMRENAIELLFRAVVFVLIVVVFRVFAMLIRRLLERAVDVSNVKASKLLQNMLISMTSNAITLLGVLVALSQLGIQMGPLLAGLGIAGFIVGFALQDSLSNFAAGMMILGYRPYDVGDMVEAAGVFGEVHQMSLVSTTILTIDNQTLIVPNGKIWGDVIKNVSNQVMRRVDMKFRVAYTDDLEHAERVLRSILDEHPKVLSDPEPVVRVHELKESSIDMIVRPWVETADYWPVYWDVTREVRVRFDREGLTIPFVQQVVHIESGEAAPGSA